MEKNPYDVGLAEIGDEIMLIDPVSEKFLREADYTKFSKEYKIGVQKEFNYLTEGFAPEDGTRTTIIAEVTRNDKGVWGTVLKRTESKGKVEIVKYLKGNPGDPKGSA